MLCAEISSSRNLLGKAIMRYTSNNSSKLQRQWSLLSITPHSAALSKRVAVMSARISSGRRLGILKFTYSTRGNPFASFSPCSVMKLWYRAFSRSFSLPLAASRAVCTALAAIFVIGVVLLHLNQNCGRSADCWNPLKFTKPWGFKWLPAPVTQTPVTVNKITKQVTKKTTTTMNPAETFEFSAEELRAVEGVHFIGVNDNLPDLQEKDKMVTSTGRPMPIKMTRSFKEALIETKTQTMISSTTENPDSRANFSNSFYQKSPKPINNSSVPNLTTNSTNNSAAPFDLPEYNPDEYGQSINGLKRWMAAIMKVSKEGIFASDGTKKVLDEILHLKRFRFYQNVNWTDFGDKRVIVPVVPDCQHGKKWAVVTTIAKTPSEAMKVALDAEWRVVVVADEKSPENFPKLNNSRFVYLSLADQKQLPFGIVPLTPNNSFSRKNIGYLYAISQGAEVIFDMDDDNVPIPVGRNGTVLPYLAGLQVMNRSMLYKEDANKVVHDIPLWNPYPYFNLTNGWPRGFPWNFIKEFESQDVSTQTHVCNPVIQQYMANLDPDVDAVFRMTNSLPIDFMDNQSFSVVTLPKNIFSPYNAQATIHLKDVFWSLLLPISVDGRVSDIWRAYITESLLYLMPDACVAFTSPAVRHARNPHSYISDFKKELPLYFLAEHFIRLVRNFPVKAKNFPEVFVKVYALLYETGVLEKSDVDYAITWMQDLASLNVTFPQLPGKSLWTQEKQLCLMYNRPSFSKHYGSELLSKYLHLFNNIHMMLDSSFVSKKSDFNVTAALDFTVNWPPEVAVHLCHSETGCLQNRCLRKCMELANNERDIFYMADDDFFDFVNASKFPGDKIWSPAISHHGPNLDAGAYDGHQWTPRGRMFLLRGLDVLKALPDNLKGGYVDHVAKTRSLEGHVVADLAYVPKRKFAQLTEAIDAIDKIDPQLFSEVGLPLAFNLVSPGDEKWDLISEHLYMMERMNVTLLRHHAKTCHFFHPLKLGVPKHRNLFRELMAEQYKLMNNASYMKGLVFIAG